MRWGHEVSIGYFAQDHTGAIEHGLTAVEWLHRFDPDASRQDIHGLLGQMLFSGEEGSKPTAALSGGETARLLFCRIMLQKPNVLVLDEPTNHLDLEAINALSLALQKFEGTVFLVTHDEDLMDAVATRVWHFDARGHPRLQGHATRSSTARRPPAAELRAPSGWAIMPRVTETQRRAPGITRAGWKIVLLASLGGTLEFYDFVVFGVFARDIAEAIFPNTTPIVSLMASFGAFAAGYLARPIGGIVLSHYGDRYGRRTVFLLSLFVMSAATLGMGLVPSYASWGVWASVTMVTLRLIQGFCIGGELPGALTYVVETAPRHAPFVCGLVFACVTLGVAVASGVSLGVRTWLPPELVPIYGWRIAFVLGGLAGLLSVLMRRAMEESPEFARMKALASRGRSARCSRRTAAAVLAGIGGLAATGGFNGLFFALMPAYLSGVLQYGARDAVIAQTVGVVVHAAAILGVGRLADRLSPRLMIGIGAAGC